MSTIQIVGIAVATVIVVLLVIALIVTRQRGGGAAQAHGESGRGSFLDAPPSDTLAKLGAAEHTPAEPVVEPAPPAAPGSVPAPAEAVAGATGDELGLDWDASRGALATPAAYDGHDSETTGEMSAVPAEARPHAAPEPETAAELTSAAAAQAAAERQPLADEAPPTDMPAPQRPAAPDRLVPLSSIIVTTSTKMVDLDDPEIRRMLTDLVTFEIDQATQFREQGQNLDAVLQLTEAEKICRALGREDTAREIRHMMRGLQA